MTGLQKFSPRSFDWVLFGSALLLSILGAAAIYSVDLSRGGPLVLFRRQLLSLGVGLLLFFLASLPHFSWYRSAAKSLYGVSILLLGAVLWYGTTIRGTRGWFVAAGFSFQPVELAKAGLILMLASVVYHFGRRFDRLLFLAGTGVLTVLPMALILAQPDLGSASIFILLWFGIMLLLRAPFRYLAICLGGAVAAAAVGWFLLQPYQQDRLRTFLNPERDPLGAGYNRTEALIAVGAGQLWGRGLGYGSQSQLRFLPEAQTDFIFSVIGEELGFVGVAVLFGLFAVIFIRLGKLLPRAPDDFVAVGISGIILLLAVQLFLNVGANLGLLPITGVTLPFVSYGGSSLVINFWLLGIAESMVEKRY
ncbi:MAG: rod shape-determining protein RodA [Candidatus Magasanikbacteria bacterium]|nr:rod shape-determining protein RodA [Candidatus Magasanikbacteria bacterium]